LELVLGGRYKDERADLFPELTELHREAAVLARRLGMAQLPVPPSSRLERARSTMVGL
jgi:hypothetical protein